MSSETATLPDTLAGRFAALEATRAATWPAEKLAANRAQRADLAERFAVTPGLAAGADVPDLPLEDTRGGTLWPAELVAHGPAVLVFFRFADCPADNIAIPFYDAGLAPALRKASIPLVGVSPQVPDRLAALASRHALSFPLATDRDNALARALGIVFAPAETPTPPPADWIGAVTGTGTWELPVTTALVIEPGLHGPRIRAAFASPDWLDRAEPAEILAALDLDPSTP